MTIQIFTPAVIGDGAIIGGVAHFVRPPNNGLAPATRIGGAPLVVRDKWYNTNDGTEWFWNGTYWLSRQFRQQLVYDSINFANFGMGFFVFNEDVLLVEAGINSYYVVSFSPNWSTTDNFTVVVESGYASNVYATQTINSTANILSGSSTHKFFQVTFPNLNRALISSTNTNVGRVVNLRGSTRTGSPTSTATGATYSQQIYFKYHLIYL